MKKLSEFLKTNVLAVKWTFWYFAAFYAALSFLFGFNIFSANDWIMITHSRLRGLPGFTFGIIMFSAIPLYIATTATIIKTKKPLFNFFTAKKEEPKKTVEEKKEVFKEVIIQFPERMPTELRGAFIRARQQAGVRPESAFDMKDIKSQPKVVIEEKKEETPEFGLPLPDNFDFTSENESPTELQFSSTPVFKEINFGDFTEKKDSKSPLIKHLESKGFEIAFDGNVVIANNFAIAVHDDSDFWIADKDNWFAAGKQKESPVSEVLMVSEKHGLNAMIYLAEKNIMEIDAKITEWESRGIKVIHKLTDI